MIFSKSIAIFLLLLLPAASYSYRVIKNQSDISWVIVSAPRGHDIKFDSLSPNVQGVCAPGSRLDKGCFLPPGKTTFVDYSTKGELIFTDGASTIIVVAYQSYNGGGSIKMKSSDESRINDNHGDITIYHAR